MKSTNNIFKLLFFLSTLVLIAVLTIEAFYLTNNKQEMTNITKQTQETSTLTPTLIDEMENSGPYITNGYFFVPYWGLKFKLSNELTDYGYSVKPDCIGCSYDKYLIGLTAVFKKDLLSNPQAKYYSTIDDCSFVTVSKTTEDMSNVCGPKKIISTNGGSLVVYDFNATDSCKDKGVGLMTNDYYQQVVDKLIEILSQPEQM